MLGRAARLFVAYAAVILAVIVAGFLGSAVGIWASILWGLMLVSGIALYWRRQRRRPRTDP
jgi:riboflavin transporter FmnP